MMTLADKFREGWEGGNIRVWRWVWGWALFGCWVGTVALVSGRAGCGRRGLRSSHTHLCRSVRRGIELLVTYENVMCHADLIGQT